MLRLPTVARTSRASAESVRVASERARSDLVVGRGDSSSARASERRRADLRVGVPSCSRCCRRPCPRRCRASSSSRSRREACSASRRARRRRAPCASPAATSRGGGAGRFGGARVAAGSRRPSNGMGAADAAVDRRARRASAGGRRPRRAGRAAPAARARGAARCAAPRPCGRARRRPCRVVRIVRAWRGRLASSATRGFARATTRLGRVDATAVVPSRERARGAPPAAARAPPAGRRGVRPSAGARRRSRAMSAHEREVEPEAHEQQRSDDDEDANVVVLGHLLARAARTNSGVGRAARQAGIDHFPKIRECWHVSSARGSGRTGQLLRAGCHTMYGATEQPQSSSEALRAAGARRSFSRGASAVACLALWHARGGVSQRARCCARRRTTRARAREQRVRLRVQVRVRDRLQQAASTTEHGERERRDPAAHYCRETADCEFGHNESGSCSKTRASNNRLNATTRPVADGDDAARRTRLRNKPGDGLGHVLDDERPRVACRCNRRACARRSPRPVATARAARRRRRGRGDAGRELRVDRLTRVLDDGDCDVGYRARRGACKALAQTDGAPPRPTTPPTPPSPSTATTRSRPRPSGARAPTTTPRPRRARARRARRSI